METLWDTGWHDWRKQMGTSNTQASVFSARRYPPSAEPTSSEGNSKWSKNKVVTLLEKAASSCSKHRGTKRQSSIIVPQFDQISATRFTTEYLIAKGNLKEASVLGDLNSHIAAEISARLVVVEAALKLDQPPAKWFGYTSRAEFANEIAETAEGLGASKILRTEVSKTGKTKTLQLYMDIVRGIAVRNNVTTHPGEITKISHRFDPVLQTICTEGKEIP